MDYLEEQQDDEVVEIPPSLHDIMQEKGSETPRINLMISSSRAVRGSQAS
jgi:hypothetical protein